MRTIPALVALALFVPATLALPPASLTPPLPSNAAILPANSVANGGFEDGLAGWIQWHPSRPVQLTAPGAAGSSQAISSPNYFQGSFLAQWITAPEALGQNLLFDYYARISPTPAVVPSVIEAIARWNPSTGAGQATVIMGLHPATVSVAVWGGSSAAAPAPTDGAWHHYQVVMVGALGLGVLLIDGVPAATATGDPASVDPANVLIVGDVAGCDCNSGPAAVVAYDEIYLGPQV